MAPFLSESEDDVLRVQQKLFEDGLSKFDTIYYADSSESDISLVELLLYSGTDPNVQSNNEHWKNTALLIYCRHGEKDIRIMHLLLEYGADIEIKTNFSSSAIGLATECGTLEIVKTLLDAGACNDLPMNRFPLHNAVYNDGAGRTRKRYIVPIIKLLVERGACVDFMSGEEHDYISALSVAVGVMGSLEGVKCLLSLGADPNLYIEGGPEFSDESPLWYAVYFTRPEIADCLLDHGADAFYKDHNGATLLNATMLDNHNDDDPKLSSYYAKDALNCVTLLMERGVTIGENDNIDLSSEKIQLLEICQQELEVLKETRIHPDFRTTYFDFLIKRDRTLVRCLRNKNIAAAMESEDYKDKFFYFSYRLEANYHRGLEQIALTSELQDLLSDVFKTIFPQELIFAISDYLNRDDLDRCFGNN